MRKVFAVTTVLALLCLGIVAHASGISVYTNNFEGAIGSEWSYSTTEVTPTDSWASSQMRP